jgi:light-regulated signal transduction histidine kinase (bacteriophytochrome)
MTSAAQRMDDLINDLLAYSAVAIKPDPFQPVDLGAAVHEVLDDLRVGMEEMGAQVEVGPLPTIDADAIQMRQLFQNLLSNALKFRRKDVTPSIRVVACKADSSDVPDGMVQIVVEDNGIGFEQKYADRIFEFFQRLHSREEYEGTGVGLSICRKIAERHRGSIKAFGNPGAGATFVVTLPLDCAEGVSAGRPREVAVERADNDSIRGG